MVQPAIQSPSAIQLPADNVPYWLDSIANGHSESELEQIKKACYFAIEAHSGQTRKSGEAYVNHTFAVAALVHELGLDYEAVIAALLHDTVEDTAVTLEELTTEFSANVARLVDGVTKMETIQEFAEDEHAVERFTDEEKASYKERKEEQGRVENLRKMMLAMVEDVRVVLIKLCDRLHNMRTMESMPQHKQVIKSRETMDIFAPLANRLGVWQLKWELEDLAFRYLEPENYKGIAKNLSERRVDRDKYVEDFVGELETLVEEVGVKGAAVKGRSKHIYSIWSKMRRKQLDFENLNDIRAVRVLVDSVQDCYAVLGVVHTTWKYVFGEFDDYIATPKENNYQSLHTAIIGPQGRVIEIQIRTHEMHKQNELGVAAHWRYKETGTSEKGGDSALENKILWLRQLMEWKDEVADANEFVDRVRDDVFEERIYVFTPKGKVIDLPAGATPIDFAYAIHTQVGHKCRGALVNGKMVPLTTQLKNGQRCEILTNKAGKPSLDWLSAHNHYIVTRRARSSVQHFFRHENRDHIIAHGRELLDKELHRMGVTDIKLSSLAKELSLENSDQLFIKVADGSLKLGRVSTAANKLSSVGQTELFESKTHEIRIDKPRSGQVKGDMSAEGVDNLLMQTANCCHPIPGDTVEGFITKGSGISVHRSDCKNLVNLKNEEADRVIDVSWHRKENSVYPMSILVEAYDRRGLLSDVATVFTEEKVNVIETTTRTDPSDQTVNMIITAELPNIARMSYIINRIMRVESVREVRRKQ